MSVIAPAAANTSQGLVPSFDKGWWAHKDSKLGPADQESVAPILFSAHFCDHSTISPTGFDSSRPIVVLDGGAQIAVPK
jgi:hypothetical protein